MTTTLIIDTSFETCQIALYRDDVCVASLRETAGGGHDRVLAGMVEKLFTEQRVTAKHIDRIFVTTGPGRFTGLRVGIAFARGFVLIHNIPLVPVMCHDAIGHDLKHHNPNAQNTGVLIGVKRGQSFVHYTAPHRTDILVVEDDQLAAELQRHAPLVIGGVLSPAAAALMPLDGVTVDERVVEPTLDAIFIVGTGVYTHQTGQNPVVRPYYAA